MVADLAIAVHQQVAGIAFGQRMACDAFFGQIVRMILDAECAGVHGVRANGGAKMRPVHSRISAPVRTFPPDKQRTT